MIIIALLIGISLSIALLFLGIFFWNIKSGQYDDTYSPSVRMLFDDKPRDAEEGSEKVNNTGSPIGKSTIKKPSL